MGRLPFVVRELSADERDVLRRALQYGPAHGKDPLLLDQIESLQVVGRCECGCASVDFQHLRSGETAEVVADAVGATSAHEQVGIIVFALGSDLQRLEIVGYSAEPPPLPVPSTIRGWEGKGAT